MVPLPPPPDLSRQTSLPGAAPQPAPPHSDAPIRPRPGQLTAGWRWVVLLGWTGVILGLFAVGGAGDVLGKRPWWLDGPLVVVPFVVPVAVAFSAMRNATWTIWAGLVGVLSLCVTALLDVADAPGAAAATGVLAVVGLLTTVAGSAGRMPRIRLG